MQAGCPRDAARTMAAVDQRLSQRASSFYSRVDEVWVAPRLISVRVDVELQSAVQQPAKATLHA